MVADAIEAKYRIRAATDAEVVAALIRQPKRDEVTYSRLALMWEATASNGGPRRTGRSRGAEYVGPSTSSDDHVR